MGLEEPLAAGTAMMMRPVRTKPTAVTLLCAQESFFKEVKDTIDKNITHQGGGVRGRFPYDSPLVRPKCATFQPSPGTCAKRVCLGSWCINLSVGWEQIERAVQIPRINLPGRKNPTPRCACFISREPDILKSTSHLRAPRPTETRLVSSEGAYGMGAGVLFPELGAVLCPGCGGKGAPDGWNPKGPRRVFMEHDVAYVMGFR